MLSNEAFLSELEPYLVTAYDNHMRRPHGESRHPLRTEVVLCEGAGIDLEVHPDALAHIDAAPILRKSMADHLDRFEEAGVQLQPVIAANGIVNILTESNLPHYTAEIKANTQGSEILEMWANRWTAEERPHEPILADHAKYSGLIGPGDYPIPSDTYYDGLESQLATGMRINIDTLSSGAIYLMLQELATWESHRNLGAALDPSGQAIYSKVETDERRHFIFYKAFMQAALEIDPDLITEVESRLVTFEMPGADGIPYYEALSRVIALSGLFDVFTVRRLKGEVVNKHLQIDKLNPTTDAAKQAQERLVDNQPTELEIRKMSIIQKRREQRIRKARESGGAVPFVVGQTVERVGKYYQPIAA